MVAFAGNYVRRAASYDILPTLVGGVESLD